MDTLLQDIVLYFDLLEQQGLYAAFHNFSIPLQNYMSVLMPYNINRNPFCLRIKSDPNAWNHCIERQPALKQHCVHGIFCGICWAGMGECVFPIQNEQLDVVAFISISGFQLDNAKSLEKLRAASKKYSWDPNPLIKSYFQDLTSDPPDLRSLRAKVAPLCRMFELLHTRICASPDETVEKASQSTTLSHAVVYLQRHYAEPISVSDLAIHCHCSVSMLSHLFKRSLGKSVRHYLRLLRIQHAKRLLQNTDCMISDVAQLVGYQDQNYFSNLFRRETGISPREYRQRLSSELTDFKTTEGIL